MLYGCAGHKLKDNFAQLNDWNENSSEGAAVNYDGEVAALFSQPNIDPLTDYLNQHIADENRSESIWQVSKEKKARCQQIADKYATRPLTQESLNLYQAGYSYSCPKDVEKFALSLAETNKKTLPTSPVKSLQSDEKPEWDKAIISDVNKEQLNDCYLLTTISNFREAKQACLSPANNGDMRSRINMAIIHKALEEYSQALEWAKKIEHDSPQARYLIGELYASGLGVTQDNDAAFNWFEKAAQGGYAEAQYMTAWAYEVGVGVQQNIKQAIRWYQLAASNNNIPAKHSLGALLVQQSKNPLDVEKGQNWLIQAAQAGYADSALLMGKLLQQNILTEDKAKALVWYEVAQQQGASEAVKLADMLRSQVKPDALNSARQQIHRILEVQS